MALIAGYEDKEWIPIDPVVYIFRNHLPQLRSALEMANYLNVVEILDHCDGDDAEAVGEDWAQLGAVVGLHESRLRAKEWAACLELKRPDLQRGCEWHKCPVYGTPGRPGRLFTCARCSRRVYCSEFCQQRSVSSQRFSGRPGLTTIYSDWSDHGLVCKPYKGHGRKR